MARYIQDGKIINYQNTASEAISYGDVLVLTDRIGISTTDISAGGLGAVELEGVFEIAAEPSPALTVGQTVYWDAANKCVTGTKPESGAVTAGMVVERKAANAAAALIKL